MSARKSVSCTKSAAPSMVPLSDSANLPRLGAFAKSSARMAGFNSMKSQIWSRFDSNDRRPDLSRVKRQIMKDVGASHFAFGVSATSF
jgi:hypothetical protein